jgi:DNA-binding GntR family transcriptional regulator
MSHISAARSAARELLADRAYDELRDRIVTLKIAPGAPIDEDLIGEQLGMGRTPVREAIKRLSLENLVTVYPRRGTFASEINITDLAHISDVRVVLEGHAAYRAAQRITAEQRLELESLLMALDGHDHAGANVAHEQLMSLDAAVHRFVYRAAANPYLEVTLNRYFNLSLRIWYLVLDRLPHIVARMDEHREVLHDILAGDPERARDTMATHVETFAREIRAVL